MVFNLSLKIYKKNWHDTLQVDLIYSLEIHFFSKVSGIIFSLDKR